MKRFHIARSIFLLTIIFAKIPLQPNFSVAQEIQTSLNDSLFSKQKQLFEKLKVLEAWKLTKGSPDILIGVIDNGFDFFHPDLKDQLIPGFYASGGYHTEIVVNNAHGTLVSSIINAKANNTIGMAGLAPKCKILTASQGMIEHTLIKLQKKYMKDHPDAELSEFQKEMGKHPEELEAFGKNWIAYQAKGNSEAIRYLVDHGVKVINMSGFLSKQLIQAEEDWKKIDDAFTYAADKNVIIVLSAGNHAQEVNDYPGSESKTIIAGASLLNDERWEEEIEMMKQKIKMGSCYGNRLTVMAPVESLVVCSPHEKRYYSADDSPMGATEEEFKDMYNIIPNGATSSAAPIVTSLIALVYSLKPDLDAASVIEIVKQGCDDIGEKGYDIYTGYGRVNFAKTLEIAQNWNK